MPSLVTCTWHKVLFVAICVKSMSIFSTVSLLDVGYVRTDIVCTDLSTLLAIEQFETSTHNDHHSADYTASSEHLS